MPRPKYRLVDEWGSEVGWGAEWSGLVFLVVLFIAWGIGFHFLFVKPEQDRRAYLAQHGCELQYEAPTGYGQWVGRNNWHSESVRVYQCADGRIAKLD